jgi:hypothetical protein
MLDSQADAVVTALGILLVAALVLLALVAHFQP